MPGSTGRPDVRVFRVAGRSRADNRGKRRPRARTFIAATSPSSLLPVQLAIGRERVMIRRRRLLQASAGLLAAPAIVERAGAQSAFDWKQCKGQKIEVNLAKSPRSDVLQAHRREFEDLTGIRVGDEQIPEQQQRPKVAMEM